MPNTLLPTPAASLLPQEASFSDSEEQIFADMRDDADLDALIEALFPDELCKR